MHDTANMNWDKINQHKLAEWLQISAWPINTRIPATINQLDRESPMSWENVITIVLSFFIDIVLMLSVYIMQHIYQITAIN